MAEENKKTKKEQTEKKAETQEAEQKPTEQNAADTKEAKSKKASKPRAASTKKKNQSVNPDFEERVVAVNRVAKVVKGGRRFSFSALMIVGDKKGKVGFGLGKAKEVPEAIRKATQLAQKSLIDVPIDNGTIPHTITGEFDAGKILFKPASEGTGVKAAGACRTILELAGFTDVLTKSLKGNNPHNIVKATFKGLSKLRSAEQVAAVRGKETKNLRIRSELRG